MDFQRLKAPLIGFAVTALILLALAKFTRNPGTAQLKAQAPSPPPGSPALAVADKPKSTSQAPAPSEVDALMARDPKGKEEYEKKKAQLLKDAPTGRARDEAVNNAFKPVLEAALKKDADELSSESNARAALLKMPDCLNRANDPATPKLPPQLEAQLGDGGLKTLMQASCVRNADRIVARYPALKSEFESKVLPVTPRAALDVARRKASEAGKY